jgi:hypothetical protein
MGTTAGGSQKTRPFICGPLVFVVRTTTSDDRELVEAVFGDLPDAGAQAPTVEFSLLRRRGEGGTPAWELAGPNVEPVLFTNVEGALSLLVSAVNIAALDVEPEFLHLHAALAVKEGRAVVVAADAGMGKTTAVALLAARGWGYVTDEAVRLPNRINDQITGFTKPLSIKPGGRDPLTAWQGSMLPRDDGTEDFRFLPIGETGVSIVEGGAPHLVVVLRPPSSQEVDPGGSIERLHPADAVVTLMQQTLDAERYGMAALRLSEFAATSHCFSVTRSTPSETADQLERLFALEPPDRLDVRLLPTSRAFAPGVISVALGDRVVVHEGPAGRIFALDAGGARVWKKLGGWSEDDSLDLEGPVIGRFVHELRALGVFAGSP